MKMVAAEEMPEDKQKRRNLVAELMGLDAFPDQQLPTTDTSGIHEVFQQQQGAHLHVVPCDFSCRAPEKECTETYEILKGSPSSRIEDRSPHEESFACLTTCKNLRHSEEFQDAIVALTSDKDFFFKALQEPSLLLNHPQELQGNTMSSEKKRIVVLKPLRMVQLEKEEQLKAKLFPAVEEQKWNINRDQQGTSFNNSAAEHLPKPTKIVVLKPNPWKPRNVRALAACVSPRNLVGSSLDTDESTGSQLRGSESKNWRDESLVSSSSFGYTGDESLFGKSVNELTEQEDANLSELEYSCSPYPSHPMAHYSPQTLVDREAKKRLSEMWSLATSNGTRPGECQGSEMSCTLSEMLTIPELKKEEEHDGVCTVSTSRSCSGEHRTAPLAHLFAEDRGAARGCLSNLSKSKCASSSSDGEAIGFSDRVSEIPFPKSGAHKKFAKSKCMSSVKGRLSNFFASWNKRIGRVKSSPSSLISSVAKLPPQCAQASCHRNELSPKFSSNDHPEDTSLGDFEENSELAAFPPSIHSGATQGAFSAEASVCRERSNAAQNITSNADYCSPSSVLDAPFEDEGTNGRPHSPEDDHDLKNAHMKRRSLPAELVPRHLSWDDTNLEAGVPSIELPPVFPHPNGEERELFAFIREILSTAGLVGEHSISAFRNWHLPDSLLDPKVLEKFPDRKKEETLNRRLIFDCVNSALLEIRQSAIWAAYPWGMACGDRWKHGQVCGSSSTVTARVWRLVRPRLSSVVCQTSSVEAESIIYAVEGIVSRDVATREWAELWWLEMDEFSSKVGEMLLEELVGEVLADMSAGWR